MIRGEKHVRRTLAHASLEPVSQSSIVVPGFVLHCAEVRLKRQEKRDKQLAQQLQKDVDDADDLESRL